MQILIDNNIILDVLQNRKPFVIHSSKVLRLIETKQVKGYITANSVTDIHYILNRSIKDKDELYSVLEKLLNLVEIIDVTAKDIKKAVDSKAKDFEDQLIIVCAERAKTDYIVTRNIKDFNHSTVPAATPEEFLTKYFEEL